jgi:hypothetical protein
MTGFLPAEFVHNHGPLIALGQGSVSPSLASMRTCVCLPRGLPERKFAHVCNVAQVEDDVII